MLQHTIHHPIDTAGYLHKGTHLEVHIWVEDLCLKTYIGSYQGVLLRYFEYNLKDSPLKGCIFWTLQHATGHQHRLEHSLQSLVK